MGLKWLVDEDNDERGLGRGIERDVQFVGRLNTGRGGGRGHE